MLSKLGWVFELCSNGECGVKFKENKSIPSNSTKKLCLAGEDPELEIVVGRGAPEANTYCPAVPNFYRHC